MCGVDRKTQIGFCGEGDKIRVAKVIENFMWEEPLVSGNKGTLAIFFSGCSLRCEYCQNYQISHIGKGEVYSPKQFADFLKSFDYSKYDSIDFITPTHFSSCLMSALSIFKPPVTLVWNSSGYERAETLEKLLPFVDVFLFDLKYFSSELSGRLSKAADYFEVASKAVKFVAENKKEEVDEKTGVMQEGVIVRHLVLPGEIADSFKVLDFLAEEKNVIVSLMQQFTPIGKGEKKRKLLPLEFKAVLAHAEKVGIKRGFYQEEGCADQTFIPKF